MTSLHDRSSATASDDTTTPGGPTRRTLLRASAVAGTGIAIAGSIDAIAGSAASASPTRAPAGYGPLVADRRRSWRRPRASPTPWSPRPVSRR